MTVCKKLWFNAEVDLEGNIQPCSSFNSKINCIPYDLDSYFASADLQKCIQSQQAGEQNPECNICWEQESLGLRSLRQSSDDDLPALTDTPKLLVLDYSLDHLCNLKCIMCNEKASSAIMSEKIALGHSIIPIKIQTNNNRLDFLKKHIPNLHELKIYNSGEPFMSPIFGPMIDLINQTNPEIKLMISTNGTQIKQQVLEKLKEVKNLTVKLSLDGYGPVNDFIRYPSHWAEIETGVQLLKTVPGIKIIVHTTIQALNLYQLDRLIRWVAEQNIDIELAPVIRSPLLDMRVIPNENKEIYRDKIKEILKFKEVKFNHIKSLLATFKQLEEVTYCVDSHKELQEFLNGVCSLRKIDLRDYFTEELNLLQINT
jgi:sulfatase maturation enzyme AslB (radical SAM superfamily)